MARYSTIDEVMASYPGRFHAQKAAGVEGVVQFHFTGERSGAYYLVIDGADLQVREGDHAHPTVTLTTPGEAWLRVSNGETSPVRLILQGRLKLNGSLPMAARFRSLFRPGTDP